MTTDDAGLGTCDTTVFSEGLCVLMVGGVAAKDMEEWIIAVRAKTDLGADEIDWHYAGGRALVKVLNYEPVFTKVAAAIKELGPMLADFAAADSRKYGVEPQPGAVFACGYEGVADIAHRS